MRYLYNLLFYLALPFVFLRLLWCSRNEPAYRKRWPERLGFTPFKLDHCIWVHAVSMGETIAATPLIKALQKQYSHMPIVVTNMTPTGSARVKTVFGDSVYNTYIPYDLPDAAYRFLKRVKPSIAIMVETEIWPTLFAACRSENIPIIVTNARLSEKSARGYQRIAMLIRPSLQAINVLAAQAAPDAERFIQLGMPRPRVKIVGNIKFDLDIPADLFAKSEVLRNNLGNNRLIWMAASTHPSEDEIMLAAHKIILEKFPQALLMLVPRHPDRFKAVAELVKQQGLTVVCRSENVPCQDTTQVYLGDTMGEMLLYYSVCDVAFVGGSFVQSGGHNMLEPAALHKPVLSGPSLFNFAWVSDMLLQANGMQVVQSAPLLASAVLALFQDEHYRKQMGENAYQVLAANRGSLQKQLDIIRAVQWS